MVIPAQAGIQFFSLSFTGLRLAYVVASRVSPREDELRRYSVALTGHFGDLNPGSHLVPDACEIVTPKTGQWPAQWDAASLVARPVSCFNTTAPIQAQIPAADTTNISAAVQDGDRTVWAVGSGPVGKLYRWRNGEWIEAPSPLTGGASVEGQAEGFLANGLAAQPIGLWLGRNGGVLVLWLTPSQNPELVWRRGGETRFPMSLSGHLRMAARRNQVGKRRRTNHSHGLPSTPSLARFCQRP